MTESKSRSTPKDQEEAEKKAKEATQVGTARLIASLMDFGVPDITQEHLRQNLENWQNAKIDLGVAVTAAQRSLAG